MKQNAPFFYDEHCFSLSKTQYYHHSLKGILKHLVFFTVLNPFIKLSVIEHEADIW